MYVYILHRYQGIQLSNFESNFYVIAVLHKNLTQSLKLFLRAPFSWKFLKIGSVIVYSFVKKHPLPSSRLARPYPSHPTLTERQFMQCFTNRVCNILFPYVYKGFNQCNFLLTRPYIFYSGSFKEVKIQKNRLCYLKILPTVLDPMVQYTLLFTKAFEMKTKSCHLIAPFFEIVI